MTKRKIKRKSKNRRPRGGDARRADAQARAAAQAFQRWAATPRDRDQEGAAVIEQAQAQGETLDEMSDEFDAEAAEELKQDRLGDRGPCEKVQSIPPGGEARK